MQSWEPRQRWHGTTVIGIHHNDQVALAGDGQISFGDMIVKHGARKLRTLHDGEVLAGFAGAIADAVTLFDKFEAQLAQSRGDLRRASVELAREWRTDRDLRSLDAQLIVANTAAIYVLSGDGDVMRPDDGIVAIGSGAPFAIAAAQALIRNSNLSAADVARQAMAIAAELCVYTNTEIELMTLSPQSHPNEDGDSQ